MTPLTNHHLNMKYKQYISFNSNSQNNHLQYVKRAIKQYISSMIRDKWGGEGGGGVLVLEKISPQKHGNPRTPYSHVNAIPEHPTHNTSRPRYLACFWTGTADYHDNWLPGRLTPRTIHFQGNSFLGRLTPMTPQIQLGRLSPMTPQIQLTDSKDTTLYRRLTHRTTRTIHFSDTSLLGLTQTTLHYKGSLLSRYLSLTKTHSWKTHTIEYSLP